MRFGYFVSQEVGLGGDPARTITEAIAEAQAAEAAGFDGVFVGEHHGPAVGYLSGAAAGFVPTPVPLMFLLAQATERVDVGSVVVLLSLAQPSRVAEELSVLDHLSGGRVIFGAGAGYLPEDFAFFGVDPERAGSRLEEAVTILRRLWSEPRIDHAGTFYRLSASLYPPPRTPGGPPVWIGGRSVPGVRRAGRVADAWVLDATPRRSLFAPWHRLYVDEARAAGRTPRTAMLRDGWLDLGGSADDVYREAALASHRAKIAAGVYSVDPEFDGRPPAEVTFADLALDRWVTCDAATIQEELDAWEDELGVEYVVLRMRTRGIPEHGVVLEQLAAFGEAVIAPRRARGAGRRRPQPAEGSR